MGTSQRTVVMVVGKVTVMVTVMAVVMVLAAAALAVRAPRPSAAQPPDPGDVRNCTDFEGWNQAQVWFETYRPLYGDVANLDADGDGIACESAPGAPVGSPAPSTAPGYWMLEANGTVFGFGSAAPLGPMVPGSAVSIAAAPGGAYWVLTDDGVVHARGTRHFGNVDTAGLRPGERVSSIAGHPSGDGYWVFTTAGRAVPFGAAAHHDDMSGVPLNGPVIASVATPSGNGYWMIGSDGGVFSFGDARYSGSMGGQPLNAPVVGIAPDPDGDGYWLVGADGGIFAFDAAFRGSVPGVLAPGQTVNAPVIGALAYGDGYLMVASDGGIFSFSDQPFLGSLGSTPPSRPIVGVAVRSAATP